MKIRFISLRNILRLLLNWAPIGAQKFKFKKLYQKTKFEIVDEGIFDFFFVFCFLLVLYLSLPTFHFRGRKNEYSAQRGWRPLANKYHSRNQRIYKEISQIKNEAP